jgi:hypothetical protein
MHDAARRGNAHVGFTAREMALSRACERSGRVVCQGVGGREGVQERVFSGEGRLAGSGEIKMCFSAKGA